MKKILPLALFTLSCGGGTTAVAGEFTPPITIDGQDPIPYPPDLFRQGVEGEVMLYLRVDSTGGVIRDSTRIESSSGYADFDAAALAAADGLRFSPATRGDTAVASPIQVPIRFSLPDSAAIEESQ
jgi:TonB family protein